MNDFYLCCKRAAPIPIGFKDRNFDHNFVYPIHRNDINENYLHLILYQVCVTINVCAICFFFFSLARLQLNSELCRCQSHVSGSHVANGINVTT